MILHPKTEQYRLLRARIDGLQNLEPVFSLEVLNYVIEDIIITTRELHKLITEDKKAEKNVR